MQKGWIIPPRIDWRKLKRNELIICRYLPAVPVLRTIISSIKWHFVPWNLTILDTRSSIGSSKMYNSDILVWIRDKLTCVADGWSSNGSTTRVWYSTKRHLWGIQEVRGIFEYGIVGKPTLKWRIRYIELYLPRYRLRMSLRGIGLRVLIITIPFFLSLPTSPTHCTALHADTYWRIIWTQSQSLSCLFFADYT